MSEVERKNVIKSDCMSQWGHRSFEVGVPRGEGAGKRSDLGKVGSGVGGGETGMMREYSYW